MILLPSQHYIIKPSIVEEFPETGRATDCTLELMQLSQSTNDSCPTVHRTDRAQATVSTQTTPRHPEGNRPPADRHDHDPPRLYICCNLTHHHHWWAPRPEQRSRARNRTMAGRPPRNRQTLKCDNRPSAAHPSLPGRTFSE